MPFPTGVVQPVFVARNLAAQASSYGVADSKLNELEVFSNCTLANIIRQLSSLSKQAEGMFGELIREAHSINVRANSLQIRLDRLSINTKQLNSDGEEVPLRPIHAKKDFKSVVVFDQQIFSRGTMPTQLLEMYSKCDVPPPLYKLNPYREDGQDCMRFYTDSNYFFELKRLSTSRDVEKCTRGRIENRRGPLLEGYGYRRTNRIVKQPYSTRERQKQLAIQNGEHIMSLDNIYYRASRWVYTSCNGPIRLYDYCQCTRSTDERTNRCGTRGAEFGASQAQLSVQPPKINSCLNKTSANTAIRGHGSRSNQKKLPPPPPPPIEDNLRVTASLPSSKPFAEYSCCSSTSANIPPAPPLPPVFDPPAIFANKFVKRSPPIQSVSGHITHLEPSILPAFYYNARQQNDEHLIDAVNDTATNTEKTQETDYFNLRIDLLKAIKDGVKLRKVNRDKQKEEAFDYDSFRSVNLILSRRIAVEYSDSDSSSSKGYDSDSLSEEIYSNTLANKKSETPGNALI